MKKVILKNKKAFTLVELMLVVIIISILAAMVIPRLTGRSEEARKGVAKADVDLNIATALKLYELDNGAFPTTEEGLDALMAAPSSAKNWKGPYLEKKPMDPWGTAYRYKSPGTHRTDFDLYSTGRDSVDGNDDDVNNWESK
jgi:general secretion pathway protein G